MSRLRDQHSKDPVLAAAAAMLRAVEPNESTDLTPAKMRQHLRARPRRSPRLLGLRPALAFALLLVLGALAGATVFRGWRRHQESAVTPPVPSSSAGVRHHGTRVAAPPLEPSVIAIAPTSTSPEAVVVAAMPAPVPTAMPAPVPAPSSPTPIKMKPAAAPRTRAAIAATPVTSAAPASRPAASAIVAAPPPPAPAKTAASPDLLLQSAMRALRFEHDAKHASELADTYLSLYPDDDLAEEAMAIGIEAHQQLDDGVARALAGRYLTRFPNGRFRAAALRAH